MKVVEVSKYPAAMMRNARFLSEDWTAVSQIGEVWGGAVLTPARYLAVEDLYVQAAAAFALASGVGELIVHGLEFWNDDAIAGRPLTQIPTPREGDRVELAIALAILRRCLRDTAWTELVVPERFLLHPGHDLRLLIGTEASTHEVEAAVRASGLFAHHGDYNLPTLDEWGVAPDR